MSLPSVGSALGSSSVVAHLDLTKLDHRCAALQVHSGPRVQFGKGRLFSGVEERAGSLVVTEELFDLTSVPTLNPEHPVQGVLVQH